MRTPTDANYQVAKDPTTHRLSPDCWCGPVDAFDGHSGDLFDAHDGDPVDEHGFPIAKYAVRVGLVLALLLLTMVAPAALVTQPADTVHVVRLDTDPAMLAVGGVLVALAYGAYLVAWRVLSR